VDKPADAWLLLVLSFTTSQEEPALVKASKAGDAERVARLLANGHDPTVRDAKGRSPYQLAANKEVRHAAFGIVGGDVVFAVTLLKAGHVCHRTLFDTRLSRIAGLTQRDAVQGGV
jgi:hypothetical protein